jgi:hypothetical protein
MTEPLHEPTDLAEPGPDKPNIPPLNTPERYFSDQLQPQTNGTNAKATDSLSNCKHPFSCRKSLKVHLLLVLVEDRPNSTDRHISKKKIQ